jgi:3',5'-cyclic AMP phosphodiesterase CpdA
MKPDPDFASQAVSRRGLISGALGMAVGGMAAGLALPGAARAQDTQRRRVLRFAHVTDTHITPKRKSPEAVAQMFAHINALPDAPAFILHTGDIIMDAMAATRDKTAEQWALWKQATAANKLPIEYGLGNHDIWGWNFAAAGATGKESDYGKQWACNELGLAGPYRTFDRAGVRFIMLDSISPYLTGGYIAKIDEAQFDWLKQTLANTPADMPVIIASHVPIVSVAVYNWSGSDKPTTQPTTQPQNVGRLFVPARGDVVLQGNLVHSDWRRLKTLFAQHKNVRAALSGHLHLIDRCESNGVSYLCNGAASAGWWGGIHMDECDFGYTVVDVYEDGGIEREYVGYGWKAAE